MSGAPVLVGIDVGATKTRVLGCRPDGTVVFDQVFVTLEWRGAGAGAKAGKIADFVSRAAVGGTVAGVGVGAHGCDSAEQCAELADAVGPVVPAPCAVVNDARLVGLAAGLAKAISVVSGTGSIAVGMLSDGTAVYAGGWGWLLGDEGGATGLVRDAVRTALHAADRGVEDELGACLATAAEVASVRRLPMVMMTTPPSVWAEFAAAVFLAADGGSALAERVIGRAGRDLAGLVETVIHKGAVVEAVVAGGGTIVNQPRLAEAFLGAVRGNRADLDVRIVADPPVRGAIELARRAAGRRD